MAKPVTYHIGTVGSASYAVAIPAVPLQPFWDPAYNLDDPGPYLGADYQSGWDGMKIADTRVPGIVTVNAGLTRHFEILSKPYTEPVLIPVGYEPLRFQVSVRIWTPRHWALIQPIMHFLLPSNSNAFDVYHPWCAAVGIKQAICSKQGPMAGGQEKTLTWEFIRWRSGTSKKFVVDAAINVAAPFDAQKLAAQSVKAQNNAVTPYTPTHGPQQAPSQAPTLTQTP